MYGYSLVGRALVQHEHSPVSSVLRESGSGAYIYILRALVGVEGLRLKVMLSYTVRATRDTLSK